MAPSQPSTSTDRALGTRLVVTIAIAVVAALGVLIVRELFPRHTGSHAGTETLRDDAPVSVAPPVVTSPVAHVAPKAAKPMAPVAAQRPESTTPAPAAPAVPLAATMIAQVAANPEAFAPSHVFAPPAGADQVFNYEPLPPFNSTTLKRTRTNPAAWELDAMHGPKLNDLGPEGAVRQAALVKDAIGNETPWYAIESGPLAPAYAVMQGNALRVMSRAFLVQNRASLPADVAAALGKAD